jgi:hypothetical protein
MTPMTRNTTLASGSRESAPAARAGGGRYRSKFIATWLAIVLGPLGAHRFYLYGARDALGWLHVPVFVLGLAGALRMDRFGQDDPAAWLLVPVLGLLISQSMFAAILYGLTPDERWDARFNPGSAGRSTAWGPILGVIVALMVGTGVLMGVIAYSTQKIFEWQAGQL